MNADAVSNHDVNDTTVAFFDFDGTLTTGDTLMPFLKFVVGKPKYYWNLLLVMPVLVCYLFKLIRNDVAKEVVLKRYLAGYHIDELFALGELFSKEIIPTMLRPEGMERLRWHQEQGHECVLVSASLDIWLNSWGSMNGFNSVITTKLEVDKNEVTGRISGLNCHGQEKVNRINSFFKNKNPEKSYAYGDTKGDFYMLKHVDSGWMLNKSKKVNYWTEIR